MYGTTQNEAFHAQLKSYSRNVMIQTRRNLQVVCNIVKLGKLLGGYMSNVSLIMHLEEHELLRAVSTFLWENPFCAEPRINLMTQENEQIDENDLPVSAKRIKGRRGT